MRYSLQNMRNILTTQYRLRIALATQGLLPDRLPQARSLVKKNLLERRAWLDTRVKIPHVPFKRIVSNDPFKRLHRLARIRRTLLGW